MSKIAASTRLNPEVMRRIEKLGKVDRRSMSDVIAQCVEEYLPHLEAEQEAKIRAVQKLKAAEATLSKAHTKAHAEKRPTPEL